MALSYTGESMKTMTGTSYKATGSQGEQVIVEASHEALQDYRESACLQKGSQKYDAGKVSNNIVTVRTSDFT
jgi:UDP-N-acetylglucosamine 2-epimerase